MNIHTATLSITALIPRPGTTTWTLQNWDHVPRTQLPSPCPTYGSLLLTCATAGPNTSTFTHREAHLARQLLPTLQTQNYQPKRPWSQQLIAARWPFSVSKLLHEPATCYVFQHCRIREVTKTGQSADRMDGRLQYYSWQGPTFSSTNRGHIGKKQFTQRYVQVKDTWNMASVPCDFSAVRLRNTDTGSTHNVLFRAW
jgi:hypothetical protein